MNAQWLENIALWACQLEFKDIPSDVVEEAKNQIMSTLSAAIFGCQSEDSNAISTFFGFDNPNVLDVIKSCPKTAACLLSSWSMVYDFDDVMLGGHTGHSSVIVPLVLAIHSGKHSTQDIITAQVVANEIAARFNIACALGQTRGQMASQLHLISSAVARAKFQGLNASELKRSIIFSLSSPSKQFLPAFLGSDAKYFCASLALREGWEACDFSKTDLSVSLDTLFGSGGFFESSAQSYDKELIDNIGVEWFTLTNSYKVFPACGYISSTIDCVEDILRDHAIVVDDVAGIHIDTNIFTLGVERLSANYLAKNEKKPISTLTFSPSFIVASMFVYGEFTVNNLHRNRVDNPQLWDLRKKITLSHNRAYSSTVLSSGIPVGLVLSRAPFMKIYSFVMKLCKLVFKGSGVYSPLKESLLLLWKGFFSRAESVDGLHLLKKKLPSSVSVKMNNGHVYRAERVVPTGFSGQYSWLEKRELMKEKYRACLMSVVKKEIINEHVNILDDFQSSNMESVHLLLTFK